MSYRQQLEVVRQRYGYRCGYCGVAEFEVGALLEIDHYCPLHAGGAETLDNLVYCCPTCNRHKSDYWTELESERLLHPLHDDLQAHLQEQADGVLVALTPRGALHIERLRLNRPALVMLRQRRRREAMLKQAILEMETLTTHLLNQLLDEEEQAQSTKEQIVETLSRILNLMRQVREG